MSFFRILLPEKKNALRLRISRVSQLHKIPENLQGELFGRILAKAGKSANSESTFNSTQKKHFILPKKSYHIHLDLGPECRFDGRG
jgi:adenine-specific DNA methylase